MITRTITFILLLGLASSFSTSASVAPSERFIKKASAVVILAATQCPSVISKAIDNINSSLNTNDLANNSADVLTQLLQQNADISSKLDTINAVAISSLTFTLLAIFLICHANYSCKPPV